MSNVLRVRVQCRSLILLTLGICAWLSSVAQAPQYALVHQNATANGSPFNSSANQREWLFMPSDFPGVPSGYVHTIYVKASAFATPVLSNLLVKMGPTQLSGLVSGPWITDGLKTVSEIPVFSAVSIADNWIPIPLQTPYFFDNTQNFLILLSQDSYAPGFNVMQGTVPGRSLIGTSTSASATVQDRLGDFGFDMVIPTIPHDAGVAAITQPISPSFPGTLDVSIKIRNYGTDTLFGTTIHWSVNGLLQNPYSWTGLLPSDSMSTAITVGNYTFTGGIHNIKAWTASPNGSTDTLNYNDTAYQKLNICNLYSGNYTIGGAGADFPGIQSAIDALESCGVAATVTLNIANGVYDEQVNIPYIPGSSIFNRIALQSATGNPADVVIRYIANENSNYTLLLNGADYIDIRNLTIQANHPVYARAIVFTAGANENTITGCWLWSNPLARGTNAAAGIYSALGADNHNVIYKNHISNGFFGIHMMGASANNRQEANIIANNILVDFFSRGVHCEFQRSSVIYSNTIRNHGTSADVYGISLSNCSDEMQVNNNRIQVSGSGIVNGIHCINSEASSPVSPAIYVNNMVIASGVNGAVSGIQLQSSTHQALYYNSVVISGSNGNNRSASFSNGYGNVNVNNIYANLGGGYAIHITGTPLATSNFNDYYTVATSLAYYGTALQSLSDLQLAIGQEANSLNLNPEFAGTTLTVPTNPLLDNMGTPVPSILEDGNGIVRSVLAPDMGAVEFSIDSTDAGITKIHGFDTQVGSGLHDIKANIRNYGLDNLTIATLCYSVNNTSPVCVLWTGNLSSGNEEGPVTLGTFNLPAGIHRIKIWTSSPNSQTDLNTWNDTLEVMVDVCESFAGTYTIGPLGTGADFVDFTSALAGLSRCLLSGPTVFQVYPGVYYEQLIIGGFNGLSPSNTLTFQSITGNASDVIIAYQASGSADNWVLRLNGASYVSVNNMTFKTATSTATYGRVIELVNGACYNTISGNVIESVPGTTSTTAAGIYSGNTKDEYNLIIGNTIRNGYYGIYLYGPSSTNLEDGNIVENNIIEAFYSYGIYQQYQRNVIYTRNTLSNAANSTSVYGMRVYHAYEGSMVTKNRINLTGSGTTYGLYTYYIYGTTASPVIVANNFVAQSVTTTSTVYAAHITNANNIKYYYNSFNVLSSANNYGVYVSTGNSNVEFVNNSVVRANGGYTIYGTLSALQSLTACDYNNYFSSGTSLAYAGSAMSNFAAWKAATGFDANGINIDPAYLSPSSLYPTNYAMNNLGTHVAAVFDDIDGNFRNTTTPDIGAVEFEPPLQDAGVSVIHSPGASVASGSHNIIVTIKNFGNGDLISSNIQWRVNEDSIVGYLWNGLLGSGQESLPIHIGSYNFVNGQALLKVWTSNPNGYPDGFPLNDTLSLLLNICDLLQGSYTIGTMSSDFSSISAAISAMQSCGVAGPVVFNIQPGIYNEQVTLGAVPGASDTNTITFQGSTGDPLDVVLQYQASTATQNWVWRFNGAQHVVLKDITIRTATSTGSYGRVIELMGGATQNRIIGNILQGKSGVTDNQAAVIYSNSLSNDYNLIKGNLIQGGSHGIYFATSSISTPSLGNVIDSNQITNWWSYGIFAYGQNAVTLTRNFIENAPNANIVYGLYSSYCHGGIRVMYNHIRSSGTGVNWCFNIYYCSGTASDHGLVANNVIHQTTPSSGIVYGLRAYSSSYQRYYHNTIKINSSATGYALLFYGANAGNRFLNNLFANIGGSLVININSLSYLASIDSMDYNNYYTSGPTLGYLAGALANLSAWKTASGFDANSVSVDPWFLTSDDIQPHAANMNNLGVSLAEVGDDFYGVMRDPLFPDLGAIEYDPILTDVAHLGVQQLLSGCDLGIETVSIRIHNTGITNVTSGLMAGYYLSGSSIVQLDSITTTIPAGDTLLYTFAQPIDLTTTHDTSLNLISWVSLLGDPAPSNDTCWFTINSLVSPPPPQVANVNIPYGGTATLEILNPDTSQLYYYWYDVPVGGNFLTIDTVYTTPFLYTTSIYYVESTNGLGNASLMTSMFGGVAQGGYMFQVSSLNPVTIDSFYLNTQNSGIVSVYYKMGAYQGYEEKPQAWTHLGSTQVTAAGSGNQTVVNLGGLHLTPSTTYSLYITLTWGSLIGTQVTLGSNDYYSDGNLSITAGTGIVYPFISTGNLSVFNGTIHYSAGNGCVSIRVPDTVFVSPPALVVTIGSNYLICQGDTVQLTSMVSGGEPPYSYCWSPDTALNYANEASPLAYPMTSTVYTLFVTDQNALSGTAQVEVVVQPLPIVTFAPLSSVYVTDPAFPLTGGLPLGGTYAGPGVSAGIFQPSTAGVGYHVIIYSYTDPATTCTASDTSVIFVDNITEMSEFIQIAGLHVFPNPSNGILHIVIQNIDIESQLELMDSQGKVLMHWVDIRSTNRMEIDLGDVPKGVYLLRLTRIDGKFQQKILIQ